MHPIRRPFVLALASAVSMGALVGPAQAQQAQQAQPGATRPALPAGAAASAPAATPAQDNNVALRSESKYAFEFSKAEVVDVVKAISDMTRQNFIIPERIKGQRITILCPNKVTANEAYQVFFTALAANGITLVRVGRFYKLVDSKDAIKDTVPTCTEVDGQVQCSVAREQMVTVLMRLRYIDAAQVNTVARALLSKDGDITVFQPSNALIVSEYAPNLKRVRKIIESLDVAGFDDALQIVPIQHAGATEVAEKLTQIFDIGQNMGRPGVPPPQGRRNAPVSVPQPGQEDGDVQISKIVPDDRTNQLIIKANRRSFDAIRHLISKIDVPVSEAEHGRVHVYYLANAKAEELSNTLQSLAQGAQKDAPGARRAPGAPNLPNAQRGSMTGMFEGEVKITADKATNSLLVMSSGHDYRALRGLIEKLDVARRQVYVEAAILEINVSDSDKEGLNWTLPYAMHAGQLGKLPTQDGIAFTGSPYGSLLGAMQDGPSLLGATAGALAGVVGPGRSISLPQGGYVTVPSFALMLNALSTSSNVNILSTPHLLTTDNEEAHIEVGEKLPFNSGIASLGNLAATANQASSLGGIGALGALGNSVQRIDVSLKLTLTPQINESNKIRLEIDQSVEDVVGEQIENKTPTTSKRAIKTVVVVDNQQTIVLGGLIKNNKTDSNSRIPYLGSIPILGNLFKTRQTKTSKNNLLLIMTPYIIASSDDFQRIFERKMREHEEFAAEFYGHRAEFRAHVDYQKKSGPLGRLVSTVRRERSKPENGGLGDGSELVVEAGHEPVALPKGGAKGEALPDEKEDRADANGNAEATPAGDAAPGGESSHGNGEGGSSAPEAGASDAEGAN